MIANQVLTSHPVRGIHDRLDVPAALAAVAVGPRWLPACGTTLRVRSPTDGSELGWLAAAGPPEVAVVVEAAAAAFFPWRAVPAPRRGEVQEMIDVCDFAVGLGRQLYGRSIASERPLHRLAEQWHPLGPVGVITAFNFPVAVWAWNAMIALVCGDPVIWKPSEKTPLAAIACHALVAGVAACH